MGDTPRERETEPVDERPGESRLDELLERLWEWVDSLVHPPVLVPVPVRRRPSR